MTTENERLSARVAENAVIVTLTINNFGVQHKVKAAPVVRDEHARAAEEGVLATSIKLLDCDEYKAIPSHAGAFKRALELRALPSLYRPGAYLLPIRLVGWTETAYERFVDERRVLVERLCDVYLDRVAEQRETLGSLFDERKYPTVDELRQRFGTRLAYEEVGVPERLQRIDPRVYQREAAALRERMEEAAQAARDALRQGLADLVKHLEERLAARVESTNGRKAALHATAVEGLKDWLALFDVRNVTDDEELAAVVARCRNVMDGTSTALLKTDDGEADYVRDRLGRVAREVEVLIAPKRKFRFDIESTGDAATP